MSRANWKRGRLAAAAALLTLAAVVALAHLPWVQRRVATSVLESLRRFGIEVRADRVAYNLLTLDVRADGLSVARIGSVEPFVRVRTAEVTLPWSSLTGPPSIDSIALIGVQISLVRRGDGSTNWPTGDDSGAATASLPLPIARAEISHFTVSWIDETFGTRVSVDDASLHLAPSASRTSAGTLTAGRPVRIARGDRESAVAVQAQLRWDGSRMTLDAARLDAPEATVNVRGSIGLLTAARSLALDYDGRVRLNAAAPWLSIDPPVAGIVELRGRATGTLDSPRADVTLTGSGLAGRGATVTAASVVLGIDANGGRAAATVDVRLPPPLAVRLQGRADATWTSWRADAVTARIEAATIPQQPGARSVALRGPLSIDVRGGEWRGSLDQRVDEAVRVRGALNGRLADSIGRTTIRGRLSGEADSAGRLWTLLQKVDVAPAGMSPAVAGQATIEAIVGGVVIAPTADARLAVTGWRQGRIGPLSVDGRVMLTTQSATIEALVARIGANTLRADGTIALADGRLAGRVGANLSAIEGILPDASPALRPSGSAALTARLSGRASSPIVAGEASGEHLSVAGQQADHVDAAFAFARGRLSVDGFSLVQVDGRLDATASYDLGTRVFTATLLAHNVLVAPIVVGGSAPVNVRARVDADLSASGTTTDPHGGGHVDLRDASWDERRVGRVSGTVTLGDRRLQATLQLPNLFAAATGSLAVAPFGAFVADAQVTDGDLAALASRLAVRTGAAITGTTSVAARAEGFTDRIAQSRLTVDLQRLDARIGDVPVGATRAGRASFDFAQQRVEVGDVIFDIGGARVQVAGRLDREGGGAMTASLDGTLGDLARVAASVGAAGRDMPALDGRVGVAATVTGPIDRPVIDASAQIDEGRLSIGMLPAATGIALRASYAAGILDLSRLDGAWQGATLSATGRAPVALVGDHVPPFLRRSIPSIPGVARMTARLESMTPAMLAPWVPTETLGQLDGLIAGTLTVEAGGPELADVRGTLVLDHAELTAAGVKFDEQKPTRLELTGGRLQIADWEWGGAGNRVTLGGGVRLDGERQADVTVDGLVDLRALGAFLPRVSTAGRAVVAARVTNTIGAPRIDGVVDIQNGEIRAPDAGFAASDLSGRLVLTGDMITVADLYGSANGGSLTIAGAIRHQAGQLVGGRVAITARGMAMTLPEALKTEIDTDLSLGIEPDALALGGDVTVQRGAYREPLSLAGGLLQALRQPDVAMQPEPASLVDRMSLDVRMVTAADVLVDNNYAQLAVSADVRVRGTVAQPVLLGRAEAREGGRVFLGGNEYRLDGTGVVDFANPSRIEPNLTLRAVTRVAGYDVNLTLDGTPERFEARLSAPGSNLSEGQIAMLLATGRVQDQGATMPAIGTDQLLAYLSGELLGVAGRQIGLDTLRLEQGGDVRFDAGLIATETDPGSRLTFGKKVRRDVDLVFSKNLTDSGAFTWIAGYAPRPNIELRVVSQENNDRTYDLRHDVTIGGAPARSAAPPAPTPRVGAVSFTRESDVPEADLRRLLTLTDGQRFDFFKWQHDRERLEQLCRDRGRFEAHVGARRTENPGAVPLVHLEFDVRCGPPTRIVITGAPREAELRHALEAAWSRSVFDAFLLEDAKRSARALLVRDGFLRASVTVAMDTGEESQGRAGNEEKRLIVTIERGSRTDRRGIVFTGNGHVSTDRLDTLVRSQGFDQTTWIEPVPLERAVATLYRDDGFIAARVTVGAPAFEGSTATVPVTIDEGPAFTVEQVELKGAQRVPEDELRQAFGLQAGAPLTRAAMDQTVRLVVDRYRSRGFGAARVQVAVHAGDTAGRARLTVTIDEGPRQVLKEVVVEGAHRTSEAFVIRAMHFNVEQPVDPAAWTEARKRLYDTGGFRFVDVDAVPIGAGSAPTSADQPVRARVRLGEWPPLRLRYGFELADQLKPAGDGRRLRPGLAGDVTYHGLFNGTASTVVAVRYTNDFRAARLLLSTPLLFGQPVTSNLFFARSREQVGSSVRPFVTDKSDFTAEQRLRIGTRLQLLYGYNFERNHTFDVNANPDNPLAFDISVNVARLTAAGIVDTRDDLVDATRGRFFSSTFEYGASALGSDLRFAKEFVEHSYYRPFARGIVFATNGRLGLALGYGQELIPSERFFAGGGNSVRGFGEGALGPRDFFGDPAGGNALLLLNEELRFPLLGRLRGVAFLDAGNAFGTIGDLSLRNLRTSGGVGLRVQTPVALIRVDMGAPLAARPGEPRVRWFFSIGQLF